MSSALFVVFLLMSPAFSKHLFSDDPRAMDANGEVHTGDTVLTAELFFGFLENIGRLTPKEREVVGQYAKGKTYDEVRSAMYLADGTLRNHNTHIYAKLGVKTIDELKPYIDLINRSDFRERLANLLKPR